jgi:glycolate oxidase iron-sulfur subunit
MNEAAYGTLDDLLHKCIHCGLCLPVCPTYNLTFKEQSSPRGRIRLMKSVHDGTLPMSDEFVDEMYFCLDCQACQTACPAGVEYGRLVEDARHGIRDQGMEPAALRVAKSILLFVLSSKRTTKMVARLLRWYQHSGFFEAVDRSAILTLFSERLQTRHAMLPTIADKAFDETVPDVLPPIGPRRGRVGFLSGCVMNVAFPDIHLHAVEVLRVNGYEVVIPPSQECCGSLHNHNGAREDAGALARKNIDLFTSLGCDALVLDSAGCSAFMKEYGEFFADDEAYRAKAQTLSAKTKEISEFLVAEGFILPTAPLNTRVTYHEACHLVHGQKISSQPRKLIQSIPGVTFVELPEATWCCGSAGIYNVVRFDDSMEILRRKMTNLDLTSAEVVATANPGCHLQLQYGIRQGERQIEVKHPISLLYEAYKVSGML